MPGLIIPPASPPLGASAGTFELSWELFGEFCRALAVRVSRDYRPDLVIGLATAGVMPAATVATMLQADFEAMKVTRRERGQVVHVAGPASDRFVRERDPIDGFGVGTRMNTSADAPFLDCAYKLVEYAGLPRRKRSEGKATWPGRKQVFREYDAQGRIAMPFNTSGMYRGAVSSSEPARVAIRSAGP